MHLLLQNHGIHTSGSFPAAGLLDSSWEQSVTASRTCLKNTPRDAFCHHDVQVRLCCDALLPGLTWRSVRHILQRSHTSCASSVKDLEGGSGSMRRRWPAQHIQRQWYYTMASSTALRPFGLHCSRTQCLLVDMRSQRQEPSFLSACKPPTEFKGIQHAMCRYMRHKKHMDRFRSLLYVCPG